MTTINKALNLGFEDHSVTLVAAGRRILINEWTLTGRTVTADQCRAIARLFDEAAGMAKEPSEEVDGLQRRCGVCKVWCRSDCVRYSSAHNKWLCPTCADKAGRE